MAVCSLGAVAVGLAGCGPEGGSERGLGDADGDVAVVDVAVDGTASDGGSDSGGDSGGLDAAGDAGAEVGDGGDAERDGGSGGGTAPSSWAVCASTADCPIQGARCVKEVSYNRPDHTGKASVTVAEVLERVPDGEGICTRACSDDPTICNSLQWTDADGQAVTARCHVLDRGASPYELAGATGAGEMEFVDEMKKGRAFAAVCLPPIEASRQRPSRTCQSCSAQGECGEATACVNLLTEVRRQGSLENGQSICAEPCAQSSECAIGFECVQLGASGGEMDAGDAGRMDAGNGDVGTDGGSGFCLPASRTCEGCRDLDGDGRGTGHCGPATARQTEVDCDDREPEAYFDADAMEHPWPGYCGPEDYNCDGTPDAEQVAGHEQFGQEHCAACGDTCTGSAAGGGQRVCVADMSTSSGSACEVTCDVDFKSADCNQDPSDGCEVTVAKAQGGMGQSQFLYFPDADADGFGTATEDTDGDGMAENVARVFCSKADAMTKTGTADWSQKPGDCDDANPATHPGAAEVCDGVDNACEQPPRGLDPAKIDEGCDNDGDGFCDAAMPRGMGASCKAGDCDDTDANTHPGAASKKGSGECTRDTDGDGFADVTAPTGGVAGTDCDDASALINPVQSEVCNGVDDDCNTRVDDALTNKQIGKSCTPKGKKGVCAADHTFSCDVPASQAGPGQTPMLSCTHETGNPAQPTLEAAGFDDTDSNCDGFDRYLSSANGKAYHAVWVRQNGRQTDDGRTPDQATVDLDAALKAARQAPWCDGKHVNGVDVPCDVYIGRNQVGLKEHRLGDGQQVYGGIDSTGWSNFKAGDQTTWPLHGTNRPTGRTTVRINRVGNGTRARGFYGVDLTGKPTVLSNVKLVAADASVPGGDSIAFWCSNCPSLQLRSVTLEAGEGAAGAAGVDSPHDGPRGPSGFHYENGGSDNCLRRSNQGYRNAFNAAFNTPSNRFVLGRGGDNPKGFFQAQAGGTLQFGDEGGFLKSRGQGGGRGALTVSNARLSFGGRDGTDGSFNDGGGGGFDSPIGSAAGAGGCPGGAGGAGKGGGHSIGLLLIRPRGVILEDVRASAKPAGDGGGGGAGASGGRGGSASGFSRRGGHGAGGDGGGGGAGGHAIGCAFIGAAQRPDLTGTFARKLNCNAGQMAGGEAGKGGAGGGSPGRNGRDGKDGAAGLACGLYQWDIASMSSTFNWQTQSSVTWKGCDPASP